MIYTSFLHQPAALLSLQLLSNARPRFQCSKTQKTTLIGEQTWTKQSSTQAEARIANPTNALERRYVRRPTRKVYSSVSAGWSMQIGSLERVYESRGPLVGQTLTL